MLLIERFQRGDMSAMDTLIQRHRDRAYQLAYRLSRDPEVASDVVADAFVRVYRSGRTFRGQCAFTTWLHKIVTNCFLDQRKKAGARPALSLSSIPTTEEGDSEFQLPAEGPSAYDKAELAERSRCVAKAVSKLNQSHQTLIVMFHSDMLSYEEISDKLDMPLGTVKSRLNRARLALRELLAPEPAFQG